MYGDEIIIVPFYPLWWRHNERDGVSNDQPHDCVYSTVYSGADQRKHQSSASLAFVRWPVNSPHKVPVTQKNVPFDDVIMSWIKMRTAAGNTGGCYYYCAVSLLMFTLPKRFLIRGKHKECMIYYVFECTYHKRYTMMSHSNIYVLCLTENLFLWFTCLKAKSNFLWYNVSGLLNFFS